MALANALGLIFSTMSIAHAVIDAVEMMALICPDASEDFNKQKGLTSPSVETAPALFYRYAAKVTVVQ